MQWIEDLQDNYPKTWRTGTVTLVIGCLLGGFMALPNSDFFRSVGISALQARVINTEHAIYWSVRARLHKPASNQQPEVVYGTLLGVDADRRILVSVAEGDQFVLRGYAAADVAIRDVHAAAAVVASQRFADVRLDVYERDQAVVWLGERPLNLILIEAGVAAADPSPPTNIVDAAFAAYYWRRAKSGEEDTTHAPN